MFVQDGFLYLIVTKHKLTVQFTYPMRNLHHILHQTRWTAGAQYNTKHPNEDDNNIYKTCKHQNSKYSISLCSQNFKNGAHRLPLNHILFYCPRFKTMIKNTIGQITILVKIARFIFEKSYNDYIVCKMILVRTIKKISRVQIPLFL